MNRRFVRLVAVLLLASVGLSEAQQTKKTTVVGYLSTRDPASDSERVEAVRLGLRKLGYVEGQNITIEYRYAEGKDDRFADLAAELVRLKVDIIVAAGGDLLLRQAMSATTTIPIVMMGGGADPVEAGLIKSLARPGGNVTGITNLTRDLGGKRLELLKETVPKSTRIAVLHDASGAREVKEVIPAVARALNLTIQPWEIRAADDLEKAFTEMGKQRSDAMYVPSGALLNSNRKRIIDYASKSRVPAMYGRIEYVAEGGLMYYGADQAESYRRVAYYVDRLLRGANPADLPVEQPTKFEFVINLKTAKQIGLTIPPNVLVRADKVIK